MKTMKRVYNTFPLIIILVLIVSPWAATACCSAFADDNCVSAYSEEVRDNTPENAISSVFTSQKRSCHLSASCTEKGQEFSLTFVSKKLLSSHNTQFVKTEIIVSHQIKLESIHTSHAENRGESVPIYLQTHSFLC